MVASCAVHSMARMSLSESPEAHVPEFLLGGQDRSGRAGSRVWEPPPCRAGETEARRRKTLASADVNGKVFPTWDNEQMNTQNSRGSVKLGISPSSMRRPLR